MTPRRRDESRLPRALLCHTGTGQSLARGSLVRDYGVAQWSSIGLAVGLTGAQIDACTFNKPSLGSKLGAIIEVKVHECGVNETEKSLLTACQRIPQPIIGSVLQYMESGSSAMSHHETRRVWKVSMAG